MNFGDPFREPCDGWPAAPRRFLGACTQHFRSSATALWEWINSSTVADYADPPGADIPPYPRPNNVGRPVCAPAAGCGGAGEPLCGPWPEGERSECPVADETHQTFHENCFVATSGTLDRSECRKIGFKNVQALKYWHGRFGFDNTDGTGIEQGAECNGCFLEMDKTGIVPTTKYRTIYRYASQTIDTTVQVYQGYTVDRYSGIITQNSSYQDLVEGDPPDDLIQIARYTDYNGVWRGPYGVFEDEGGYTWWFDVLNGPLDTPVYDSFTTGYYTLTERSQTAIEITASWKWEKEGETTIYRTVVVQLDDPYAAWDLGDDVAAQLDYWDLTDDEQYPWRTDEYCGVAPLVTQDEAPGANPDVWAYDNTTSPDYTDPNAGLYSGGVMGDPHVAGRGPHFDWDHQTYAVCVGEPQYYTSHYGAFSGQANEGDVTDAAVPKEATQWTDQHTGGSGREAGAWLISNSVAGPGSGPGHGPHHLRAQKWAEIQIRRPAHNYFRPCGEDRYAVIGATSRCIITVYPDPSEFVPYRVELQSGVPMTGDYAVVWGTGDVDVDGVWEVNWIADDLYDLIARVAELPAGYGAPGAGSLWELGPHFAFQRWLEPEVRAICGRLAVAGASNTNPILISLAEPAPYLRTGDTVDITGVLGNTAANVTGATITVYGETQFTLNGVSGSGDYTSGGQVQSADAPDYQWHDTTPKGDYVIKEWEFNNRDLGENIRLIEQVEQCALSGVPCEAVGEAPEPLRANQAAHGMPREVSAVTCATHCLPFAPCAPAVICISPNGEVWENGTTHDFPAVDSGTGNFLPDPRYGGRWQGTVEQHMDDPLWEEPPVPCIDDGMGGFEVRGVDFHWREDDGSCREDGETDPTTGKPIYWYARRPMVEARCAVPAGAPALPADAFMGCLSIAELDVETPPDGVVCVPPTPPGLDEATALPVEQVTPWGIYLREQACVCDPEERADFREAYGENGVAC